MSSVAILSDIHGNFPALEAVLSDVEARKIRTIYCLGDLVGYYCMINEVVDEVREKKITVIRGNHEEAMIKTGGVIPTSKTCTSILKRQLTYISAENLDYLSQLPESFSFTFGGKRVVGVHGGLLDNIQEYLTSPSEQYFASADFDGDMLLSGHTHISNVATFGRYMHINPGSVGQPRDLNPNASYAIMSDDGSVEII